MDLRRSLPSVLTWCLLTVELGLGGCADDASPTGGGGGGPETFRIAFGSCMHQDLEKPVLDLAASQLPDAFVFLGDNVYADTAYEPDLREQYRKLGRSPELERLRGAVPLIVATWDDHDYGWNDAGNEWPFKQESKEAFMDFWGEPSWSPRRARAGVYVSYRLSTSFASIQLILLDTRWFRDRLDPANGQLPYKNDYRPTQDETRTMLGEEQWAWLEQQLSTPADLRIIGTSTQFGHSYNGWESWNNMPHERKRMIDLIASTHANATVFISGDVHWGELSRQDVPNGYPLYDLTSSGITEEWTPIEDNTNRIGSPVADNNFGMLDITTEEDDLQITFRIMEASGETRVEHTISASELSY